MVVRNMARREYDPFNRPLIIKDDEAAARLIEAATCKHKPIDNTETLKLLESGRRLLERESSRCRRS
jgi:hypothetical protein